MEVFNNKVEICVLKPRDFPSPKAMFLVLPCSLFYHPNSFDYSQIKANLLITS